MRLIDTRWNYLLVLAIALLICAPSTAFAGLLASATVSTTSTSAPYDYTVTLQNTGTTNIGTFWFGWTATPIDYDFLPSLPTVTSMPTGWIAPISHNSAIPGDGYGIEYYNLTGSAIAPGGTAKFEFTSPDSPAVLESQAFFPVDKVTTSFLYIGFPFGDAGQQFDAKVVPEPTGLLLAGAGAAIGLLALRRAKRLQTQ
ncbi:MAG TPA: hypothetical protein VGG64_25690 [Pirellulales bacterium]|jgi:hypothetical protein